MEKELNIAEILKDKPNAKLWSPIVGECKLKEISPNGTITIEDLRSAQYYFDYLGRLEGSIGETVLFPSKSMRDWSKFAWKKGDVLVSNDFKCLVIFSRWTNDEYTEFEAAYLVYQGDTFEDSVECTTDEFSKTSEENIKECIKKVEEHYGGKLNLSTLKIEKPQFKDGDIVYFPAGDIADEAIFIAKVLSKDVLHSYVYMSKEDMIPFVNCSFGVSRCLDNLRLATDSEKQQLFSALAKENKAWDAEKKAIVDLPKKCEFKPKDWCLMRGGSEHINSDWTLCQFSHLMKCGKYRAIGGCAYNECIPYNDQTAHLLGTTDGYAEGGEE